MVFETVLQADLQRAVQVVQLRGNLFSADNGGNKITVDILDGGEPATVSGTVSGYVIRDDNKTVVIEGSLSGNKASITLPSSAYAVIGPVSIVIKVGTTTVAACTSFVYQTTTDVIVDPGEVIPSIAELLALIDACEEATADANAAAAAAGTAAENVATIVAPAFAQATANDPDTYVTKDGKMYLLPDGHTAGTTWENTTKTETKVGSEISNLLSAITTITGNELIYFTNEYYISDNVSVGDTVSLTPTYGTNRNNYAIVDVSEGDKVTINGTGGNAGRLWAYVDSSNKLISVASNGESATDKVLVAPASAAKLILNILDTPGVCFRGEKLVSDQLKETKRAFEQANDSFVDSTVTLDVTWARGSFDSSGGETSSTIRIRTGYVYVGNIKSVHLVPASSYKIGFEMYANDGTYLGEVSMGTDDRYISLGKTERNVAKEIASIRFLAGKSNNGTIYASDGSNFTMYGISKSVNRTKDAFVYSDNIASALWDRLAVPVDPDLFEIGKYQRNNSSSAEFVNTSACICNRMIHPIKLKIDDQISLTNYTNYSLTVVRKIGTTYYTNTVTSGIFINDADCDAAITLTHASAASLDAVSLIRIIRTRQKANVQDGIDSWQVGYGLVGSNGTLTANSAGAVSNFFYLRKGDLVSLPVSSGFDCYVYRYSLSDFTKKDYLSINSSSGYAIVGGDDDLYYARIFMSKHSQEAVTENEIKAVAADWIITKANANIQPERKAIGVGHMGYYYAPQNSVIGVQMAAKAGWKAVEVDVHFTSDNVAVGIHNQSINSAARNDDGTEISETININEITYEEALEYDFGIVKGSQFAETRISKIDDIFKAAHQLGLLVMLDIKDTPVMTRTQIEKLVDIVNDNGMIKDTIFMVGQVMKYGQWIIRKDKTASVTGYGSQSNWEDSYAYISGYNTVYYDSLYSTIDEEYTAACIAAGFPQGAYTINDSTTMDALPNCIVLYTSDYLNAENYFARNNNQAIHLTTPGVRSSRATSIVGGYTRNGNTVRVDIQFTGNADHSLTPGVFTDMPVPENGNAVLRCVKYTGTLSEPTLVAEIPCMVNDSVILLKELENGGKYVITGEYSI